MNTADPLPILSDTVATYLEEHDRRRVERALERSRSATEPAYVGRHRQPERGPWWRFWRR